MSYKFNFDISRFSQPFFREVARVIDDKNIHKTIGKKTRYLVKKFNIHKLTGLPVNDALIIVEDLVDTQIKNLSYRKKFLNTKKRALLLPHCSRKHMDSKCKATFDPKIPTYTCNHCTPSCLINKATKYGKKKGYDVFVIAGGSCIPKIIKHKQYDGIVGVACCDEIKLGMEQIRSTSIAAQGLPLVKNGCSMTKFNTASLKEML
jgi:hypothetical protein